MGHMQHKNLFFIISTIIALAGITYFTAFYSLDAIRAVKPGTRGGYVQIANGVIDYETSMVSMDIVLLTALPVSTGTVTILYPGDMYEADGEKTAHAPSPACAKSLNLPHVERIVPDTEQGRITIMRSADQDNLTEAGNHCFGSVVFRMKTSHASLSDFHISSALEDVYATDKQGTLLSIVAVRQQKPQL